MVTRSSRLIVPMAVLLLMVLVACGGESKPTPSPTATSTPSPTPTPSPSLSPTAPPAPKLITVDPVENPARFLRALPASERECLEQAVGSENLEEFISSAEPAKETLQACLSEETVRSVILGRRDAEAEQEACLVDAIGKQAGRELLSGQRQPSSDELDVLVGCGIRWPGSNFPDFDTLPEASAPAELGTVAWTYNLQESSALFARLPSEIAGHGIRKRFDRSGPNRFDTTYGQGPQTHEPVLWATVQDLAEGDFYPPDTNVGQLVALFAQGFEWEVLAAGREGELAWVQFKTTASNGGVHSDAYGMFWGNAPSSVVFGARANDSGGLIALVEAMVSAAGR